jgi:hypothetical protein
LNARLLHRAAAAFFHAGARRGAIVQVNPPDNQGQPPVSRIPTEEHSDYSLLWDLADEMARLDGKSADACWLAIMDAFWAGELPSLFVFVLRPRSVPGRELMKLPSREVLASDLLGHVKQIEGESADAAVLSQWIVELRGWKVQDYLQQPEPVRTYAARDDDARLGFALFRADFEPWRARRHTRREALGGVSGAPPLNARRRGHLPVKFEQTKAAMRRDIQEGRMTADELRGRLEKELAAAYNVSRDTARKARNAVLSEHG